MPTCHVTSELYTLNEAARELRVDVSTVKRWARTGQIGKVVLPSGHTRIAAADLRKLYVPATPRNGVAKTSRFAP